MRAVVAALVVVLGATWGAEARGHRSHGYSDGRPARWCGWFMRTQVGADPGPEFNLARSWARWGSPAGGPGIGVVVVWPHHVGRVVGQENGSWVVLSGNDGGRVRSRVVSLRGAIAFRR